jgi:hypothetical protein
MIYIEREERERGDIERGYRGYRGVRGERGCIRERCRGERDYI